VRIVPTSYTEGLTSKLSSAIQIPMARVTRRRFADGELYVKMEEQFSEAILVGNTYPDQSIIDILLTHDAIKNAGAKRQILVVPYFGYARQDSMFQPYEAISAKVISELLYSRFEKIFVVNMHSPEGLVFLKDKGAEIRAESILGEQVKKDENDLVVSPDGGFMEEAKNVGRVSGLETIALMKTRISDTKVKIEVPDDFQIKGKKVALVDDLISTGGTVLEASKILKEKGASKINVYCVHGLFVGGTSKYTGFVDEIITTDTIEGPFSKMSVSNLVSSKLREYLLL
jgi:ribose-phosphate pyrophosphokinase